MPDTARQNKGSDASLQDGHVKAAASDAVRHSDGPWHLCRAPNCRCGIVWDASANVHVATVHGTEALGQDYYASDCAVVPATRHANARLIAASPDLLAEMKRFLPVLESAEANPNIWHSLTMGRGIATANAFRAAIAKAEGR